MAASAARLSGTAEGSRSHRARDRSESADTNGVTMSAIAIAARFCFLLSRMAVG
jgi:hypothetical protein